MKKFLTWILLLTVMIGSFSGCGMEKPSFDAKRPESFDPNRIVSSESDAKKKDYMNQLISDAKKEGALVVYGSCEEEYLTKACRKFEQLYDIDVQYERLSSGEVQSKIEEENGILKIEIDYSNLLKVVNEDIVECELEATINEIGKVEEFLEIDENNVEE